MRKMGMEVTGQPLIDIETGYGLHEEDMMQVKRHQQERQFQNQFVQLQSRGWQISNAEGSQWWWQQKQAELQGWQLSDQTGSNYWLQQRQLASATWQLGGQEGSQWWMQQRQVQRQGQQLENQQWFQGQQYEYQTGTGAWGGAGASGWAPGIMGQPQMQRDMMAFTQSLREITHEMIDVRRGYEQQQIQFTERGMEMGHAQQMESMGLQRAMWQENVQYQRASMGQQYGQMVTQQGWRMEDIAYGRQMAGFQQEFQMDELGRDIRLATGREKAGLLRRREFMEESYAMQEGRRGVEEERATQVGEWETARFELQKTHFEATVQLQEQQYQMNLEHIEERYSLEQERLEAQKQYIVEIQALEDQQRGLQEAWEDRQQQYQLEMAERAVDYYENVVFVNMQKEQALARAAYDDQVTYTAAQHTEDLKNHNDRVKHFNIQHTKAETNHTDYMTYLTAQHTESQKLFQESLSYYASAKEDATAMLRW